MLNREREQEILNILKLSNGFATVKYLCDTLYVSESSIRRDLQALEKRGLLKKTYGGAELISNFSNIITFNERTQQNVIEKRAIASKAASLIKDGDIVFLDQSSTAFYLANEIIHRSGLTIVTNNTEILIRLANSNLRVMSSGGYLSNENRNCLIGGDAINTFSGTYADIMFFSAKSINSEGIISDCSREEIVVRNAMMKNAATKVFLCDSAKFDTHSAFKQCDLHDVDYFISEDDKAQIFIHNGEFPYRCICR